MSEIKITINNGKVTVHCAGMKRLQVMRILAKALRLLNIQEMIQQAKN